MKKLYFLLLIFLFLFVTTIQAQEKNEKNKSKQQSDSTGVMTGKKKSMNDLEEDIEELKEQLEEYNELELELYELKKKIDELDALKLSGFFDVSISNYKNKPNVYAIGDFELNIEHTYKENFQVAAALVFQKGADLAVAFIDYHLFGGAISPRGRLFVDKGLHIQVGKFDVPFGNDWRYFLPISRISVTPPLTTEMIMEGGYNDEGIRILLKLVSLNASIYMVDGIEEKYSYGGNSFGGRIGLTPFNNPYRIGKKEKSIFELGFSYIYDINSDGTVAENVYAVDLESKIDPLFIQAEYYNRDKNAGIVFDGYHITAGFDFTNILNYPLVLYSRYDYFRMINNVTESDEDIASQGIGGEECLTKITAGININISNISYLKLEYQQFIDAYEEYREDDYYSEILYYVQLVIKF